MSLRDLAARDNVRILADQNGFTCSIGLTDLQGTTYQVYGTYNRTGVDIDPETGLLVPGSKSFVHFNLFRYSPSLGLVKVLGQALPEEDWIVEVVDILGNMVRAKATSVMIDKTLGFATLILRK